MTTVEPEEQFATYAQQTHAARLGMWLFLASEALLFSALIALYCASRAENVGAFDEGVRHMKLAIGTTNTFVLLTSSLVVALASPALKTGHRGRAIGLTVLAIAFGAAFLALKLYEYVLHFREGIYPGGHGDFFAHHAPRGVGVFFTLYYVMTGLHALHVTGGMCALGWAAFAMAKRKVDAAREHKLEFVALYWHLVDVVWIFLWPLLYLIKGGG